MKKLEYVTVGIPKVLKRQFEEFKQFLGYRSFNEFCVEAVREALTKARIECEMRMEKIKQMREIWHEPEQET